LTGAASSWPCEGKELKNNATPKPAMITSELAILLSKRHLLKQLKLVYYVACRVARHLQW
jgi:hypothetical protein